MTRKQLDSVIQQNAATHNQKLTTKLGTPENKSRLAKTQQAETDLDSQIHTETQSEETHLTRQTVNHTTRQ